MGYFIVSMLLWLIAIFLIISEPKDKNVRLESAVLFLAGCGGIATLLEDSVSHIIRIGIIYGSLPNNNFILQLSGFFNSLSHYWAPYAFLVLNIRLSGLFLNRWKKLKFVIYFLLAIPPALMYFFFPSYPGFSQYKPSLTLHRVMVVWVTAYAIMSYVMLVYSYIKAESPKLKRNKLLICILFIPTTCFILVTNFICVAFQITDLWSYNIWIVLIQVVLCLVFMVRYGVLVSFEKGRVDKAIRVMTSGTGILNHTIKNEVMKISLCADNIKYNINDPGQELSRDLINQNLDIILNSTEHMVSMVKRIHEHMQDIMLVEEHANLEDIINDSLQDIKPYFVNRNISLVNEIEGDLHVVCDKIHIKEVLNNILKNAVEAMAENGILRIYSIENKNNITIAVKDNGQGISKENLQHIIDPFFSTKNHKLNFGLGLSYCYNVMKKHGGAMEVRSKEKVGTTVFLYFPTVKSSNKPFNIFELKNRKAKC